MKNELVDIVADAFGEYYNLKLDNALINDHTSYNDINEYWLTYWTDEDTEIDYYACFTKDNELVGLSYKNVEDESDEV